MMLLETRRAGRRSLKGWAAAGPQRLAYSGRGHIVLPCAQLVHSKLDYCNSLYYNLSKSQINRLQVIQNSLAQAVVKAPKLCHVTPILKSLHWLKINERIEYKLFPTKLLPLLILLICTA